MYKRVVTYEDYDGNKRTEEHYFHLNKAEILQWLTCNGGFTIDKQLQRLYEASRGRDIMEVFEDLLKRSYGKKSLDGRRFDKSEELWQDFKATEAYSIIYTELITDAKKAGAFINAIIPNNLAVEVNKIMEENRDGVPEELRDYMTTDVLDESGKPVAYDSVKPAASNVTPIAAMPTTLPPL